MKFQTNQNVPVPFDCFLKDNIMMVMDTFIGAYIENVGQILYEDK